MNQQIEHLLYQTGLTAQGCWDGLDDYTQQAIEKFALLIASECAALCDRFQLRNMQPAECAGAIRKMFEIES